MRFYARMGLIVGLAVVFVMVFGGYISAGGKFAVILHALPHELTMIGGAAIGAMIVSNSGAVLKATAKSFGTVFKGAQWKKQDYIDILSLLFLLVKLMRSKGMIALEPHVEKPGESAIFGQFPKILHDHFALDLICDTLRMMTMGVDNAIQVEDILDKKLEKHHHEHGKPAHVLQNMADALPAIGIVAAVLGIIKTMSAITEPPEVLGAMIGGALVGTFMGVFLAYCIVGPMSQKLSGVYEEDHSFYCIIRDVIISHLKGNAPQIAVEIGRGSIPGHIQPSFQEIEEVTSQLKAE